MKNTPRTDEVMRMAHGKIESARACDLEDLARQLELELNALCDALRGHVGDTDGYEFGLGRVKFKNGSPTSFLWAGQDEIEAAIQAAIAKAAS